MKKYFLFLIILSSCTYNTMIYKNAKENYIKTNEGLFIQANYKTESKINPDSKYQIHIENYKNEELFVFSTVLENSLMFYSEKNYVIKGNKIVFNSFYNEYMENAVYSGIKKFNFIRVLPKEGLIINIDERYLKRLNNIKVVELYYYYFYDNMPRNLININKTKLLRNVITINI